MADMKRKVFDWSKLKNVFSQIGHLHDDRYSKLGHSHGNDAIYASLPDYTRAVRIEVQEAWKSTSEECYDEYGVNRPFVLKLKHPCYITVQRSGAGGEQDDDIDWSLWWGVNYKHVCACNRAKDHTIGGVFKGMTADRGFSGCVPGVNLFDFNSLSNNGNDGNGIVHCMSAVDWWYRPFLGGGGSNNENYNYWYFVIIPMIGTPSGTLLCERYLFTADNSESSLVNTNVVLGTKSGSNNVITYSNGSSTRQGSLPMNITAK